MISGSLDNTVCVQAVQIRCFVEVFMCRLLIFAMLGAVSLFAVGQDDSVKRIEARFAASKPDAKRLAFYSLDWAMNLDEAKVRAAKEHRPILIVLNTNITAGTNFFSGHT